MAGRVDTCCSRQEGSAAPTRTADAGGLTRTAQCGLRPACILEPEESARTGPRVRARLPSCRPAGSWHRATRSRLSKCLTSCEPGLRGRRSVSARQRVSTRRALPSTTPSLASISRDACCASVRTRCSARQSWCASPGSTSSAASPATSGRPPARVQKQPASRTPSPPAPAIRKPSKCEGKARHRRALVGRHQAAITQVSQPLDAVAHSQ